DAVLADDAEVLDAAAAEAFEVDARLDRDDVAGLERVGRLGGQPRCLVHHQADAVAQAVAEVPTEPGGGDRVPREGIRLDARHPPLDARAGPLLRLETHVVGLAQRPWKPARGHGARAVAAVAVDARAPVDGDERAAVDDAIRGARVRQRAVRPGRDD